MSHESLFTRIERLYSGPPDSRSYDRLVKDLVYGGAWVDVCAEVAARSDITPSPWDVSGDGTGPFASKSPMALALLLCDELFQDDDSRKFQRSSYRRAAEGIAWCAALAHALRSDSNAVTDAQVAGIVERFQSTWWWAIAGLPIRAKSADHSHLRWIEHGIPGQLSTALHTLSRSRRELPLAPCYDLIRRFLHGHEAAPRDEWSRQEIVRVPLEFQARDIGLIAELRLELREHGTGLFYPDPCAIPFLEGDRAFLNACNTAWELTRAHLPENADVRWSLTTRSASTGYEPNRYDLWIQGDSASAAFAVGLLALAGRGPGRIHPLRAITGALEPDGSLRSVGGYRAKLNGARAAAVTSLVYPAQDEPALGAEGPHWVNLRPAPTLTDAFELMRAEHPAPMPSVRAVISADAYGVFHTPIAAPGPVGTARPETYLVERHHEMRACELRLAEAAYVCLTGKIGSGKTSLARVRATLLASDYDHICWVDMRQSTNLPTVLRQIAQFLSWHGLPYLENQLALVERQDSDPEQFADLTKSAAVWLHNPDSRFVLCFDDLDEVKRDAPLADFVKRLVSHTPAGAYCILTAQTYPVWLASRAEVPLPDGMLPAEARALLAVLAPGATEEQILSLIGLTGGTPGLLELAARDIQSGRLGTQITPELLARSTAETLLRQLDRSLEPPERRVLFAVTALQRVAKDSATLEVITALIDLPGLADVLDHLVERRCISRVSVSVLRPEVRPAAAICYQLPMVDQTFYYTHEQLGSTSRRALHRRAARFYEESDNLLLAAHHHDLAGDYPQAIDLTASHLQPEAPSAGLSLWDIARSRLWTIINQGELPQLMQLLERYQIDEEGEGREARQRLSQLSEAQVITVHLALGQLYLQQGNQPAARAAIDSAVRCLRNAEPSLEQRHTLAFAHYLFAESWEHEDTEEALGQVDRAITLIGELREPEVAALYYKRASILQAQGAYREAIEAIRQGALYDSSRYTRQRAGALLKLGSAYSYQGEHREAIEQTEDARRLYWAIGDEWGLVGALHNLGIDHEELGQLEQAERYYEQALSLAEHLRVLKDQVALHLSRGILFSKQGRPEARDELLLAITLAGRYGSGFEEYLVAAQASLSTLLIRLGERDAAEMVLDKAHGEGTAKGIDSQLVEITSNLALIELAKGRVATAMSWSDKAIMYARKNRSFYELAVALRVRGKVLAAQGELQAAGQALQKSLRHLAKKPYDRGLTLVQLGMVHRLGGDLTAARTSYGEARDIFAGLGSAADLVLVDELLAQLPGFS